MRFCLLVFLTTAAAWSQSFTLGTTNDPCVGGTAFTTPDGKTVRWGDFTCTFQVASNGAYTVRMDFLEPCTLAGSCSMLVTKKGQRVQNVYMQDTPALWNYDIAAAGLPSSSRTVLAYSTNGTIIVRVQTVVRAGILSGVTIEGMFIIQ